MEFTQYSNLVTLEVDGFMFQFTCHTCYTLKGLENPAVIGYDLAQSVKIFKSGVLIADVNNIEQLDEVRSNNYWIWALQLAYKTNGAHVSDIATILWHIENYMPAEIDTFRRLEDWIANELDSTELDQFEGIE